MRMTTQHSVVSAQSPMNRDHRLDARLLQIVMEESQDGVMIVDRRGNIRQINQALSALTGYRASELKGRNIGRFLAHIEDSSFFDDMMDRLWHSGFWQGDIAWRNRQETTVPVRLRVSAVLPYRGPVHLFVVQMVRTSISSLFRPDQQMESSSYDTLTGLPNRLLFEDRLSRSVTQARRHGNSLCVMFLDLDRFQMINESLGYAMGNKLLKAVAERLAQCLRTSDSVARIGADEFGLLLSDLDEGAGPIRNVSFVARKMYDALVEPVQLGSQEVAISATMGITLYPQDGNSVSELMKNASTALDHARRKGPNNYQFFSSEMTETARRRFELESSLRHATDRNELRLFYQPQIDLRTGELIGAEALVRWQHPHRGLISPLEFIPVAEETGLIVPIGNWVLRTACQQIASWRDQHITPVRIGVNISALQFKKQDLAALVEQLMLEWQIDPELLDLEITESAIVDDVERAVTMLRRINKLGIKLSIDDFGTGYSSLSQLRQFPFKTLKIDRSFVQNISTNNGDTAIVHAIIAMAHSLDQTVIVEGLETTEQLDVMRRLKCNEMQGFLFSAPVPAEVMTEMLRQGRKLEMSA
ncbi:MAG: EAL domain-containing protein [Magnetococcales bacterium]|nr:EAL domain-containing protein [Magnetococcales bacterium]